MHVCFLRGTDASKPEESPAAKLVMSILLLTLKYSQTNFLGLVCHESVIIDKQHNFPFIHFICLGCIVNFNCNYHHQSVISPK